MKRILLLLVCAGMILAFAGCELGGAENPQKNIAKPYISIQPKSASYHTDTYTAVPLEIAIWDWNSDDGDLSYQWYSFTDIDAYGASGGTAISGAGGSFTREQDTHVARFTPDISSPAGGAVFYYYAVVTNTNKDALDTDTAILQSEVAVISFSNPGYPFAPIISKHPSNARYGWGATLNALKVEASVPEGNLTYQWYANPNFSVDEETSTAIPMANRAVFTPDPAILDLENNYFFVIVTNTLAGNTTTATSIPAIITIEQGIKAAAPRIEAQPRDAFYFDGDDIAPLVIQAVSLDRGTLSYQWFSNVPGAAQAGVVGSGKTEALNTGGAAIIGANGASYTPPIDDLSTEANYYYYVEVTNTNPNVRGESEATVTSRAVKIRVGEAAGDVIEPNATFTINPGVRYQYIRGYGGMDVAWGNFPETYQRDTELMYDPDRMGYNMLRVMIKPNYVDVEETMRELLATDRPNYYENIKIVNRYGGYVAAAPWTPPKEWKSNNSINGGGNLIPAYYRLYANYLRSYAQHMYNQGAPIYCISISNEPNYVAGYDGCEWTNEEMRDFFLQVGHFTDGIRGYGGGRETPYVLTMNGESANTPNINLMAMNNPVSKSAIDVLARHIYGERRVSLWNDNKAAITRPDGSMMEVWMTEHNINSANATGYYNDSSWDYVWRYMNDVDLVIRLNNENAFVWWASKRFYSMIGDGQFGTTDGSPLPRGWGLSHYSRYSIDTTRIGINMAAGSTLANGTPLTIGTGASHVNSVIDNMDNTSVRITAFESADGNSLSLVMFSATDRGSGGYDIGTVQFNLPAGYVAQSVSGHRSWGGTNDELFQPYDGVTLSEDRNKAYITMGRGEIISVKFTGYYGEAEE